MRLMLALAIAGTLQTPPSGPVMPYVDEGACPFECCTYRDWTAATALQAYATEGLVKELQKPTFKIAAGERLTAMTGVVVIRTAGVVRIEKPIALETSSKRFPDAAPERVDLEAGNRLYLLTSQGEGQMSGWYNGRVLESFDTLDFAAAADCPKRKRGCSGVVERQPDPEWWVKVRNAKGLIGWVRMPKPFGSGFAGIDRCG